MLKTILIGFLSFAFSTEPRALVPGARQALLEGNFYNAENILNTVELQDPSFSLLPLYRGYLQLALDNYPLADQLFQTALLQNNEEKDVQEILIAQSVTALLSGKEDKFPTLAKAKQIGHFAHHLILLDGMKNYVEANFSEAIHSFVTYRETLKTSPHTGWLDVILEKHFPVKKIELFIAHAMIEEGRIEEARDLIRCYDETLTSPYLALSYIKEAMTVAAEDKDSYDKLAAFYFAKTGSISPYSKELIVESLKKEILKREATSISLIGVLENWKAIPALTQIADVILGKHLSDNNVEALSIYRAEGSIFYCLLNKKVFERLKGTTGDLLDIWQKIEGTSFATGEIQSEISKLFSADVLKSFALDDERLAHTTAALNAWQEIEDRPAKCLEMANELVHHGKLLWLKEGEEKKGSRLIKLALSICPKEDEATLTSNVIHFFENLYVQAERSNLVKRLLLVHEAMDLLAFELARPTAPTTIANYMADAEYLFGTRQYSSCKVHAELIMKLEGENEEALRLYGLSLYHLGDYSLATAALQKLTRPDEYAEKALMLSLARTENLREKHLVALDTVNSEFR